MANYGYIDLRRALKVRGKAARIEHLTGVLIEAVKRALGDRWVVHLTDWEDEGPVWIVSIPGTASNDKAEARKRLLAPGEDVGFAVAFQPGPQLAFRHSMHTFESWAQGCLEEELADHFNRGVFYDATDRTAPPGTRERRQGSFLKYLTRNFKKPLDALDAAWVDRYKEQVPEGFWDGPGEVK
jgi:hypothetical protein